jgi:hypothetical protein
MREHEVVSRYDTQMQDIMSTKVEPRNRWDDVDSHPPKPEVDETKLLEIWKELVRLLASDTNSAEHVNAPSRKMDASGRRVFIANSEPDDCYLNWRSHSTRHDYAVGALLAFNPFPILHTSYTCKSDFAALAGDWEEVRSDMVDAWRELVREDPVVKRFVEKSLEEERTTY